MSMKHSATPSERLEYFSIPEPNSGCLLWCGATNGHYGVVSLKGRMWLAHRLAWTTWRGPIPTGKHVLHRCDVRSCINPDHMFLGTWRTNTLDCVAKGRNNPARGERNFHAKLTLAQVIAVRADQRSQTTIAAEYGVTQGAISNIKRRRNWREQG